MSIETYAGLYSMLAAAAASAPPGNTPVQPKTYGDDPFANEIPLTDDEMREQRGGFFVSGLLLDFSIRITELTIDTALNIADPNSPEIAPPTNVDFDPSFTTVIIDNTIDGAVISQQFQLDIAIPNFSDTVSLSAVAREVSSLRVETRILDQVN